jgi:hypothetical protein
MVAVTFVCDEHFEMVDFRLMGCRIIAAVGLWTEM